MSSNRLAHENSPYLLQHAHNPVDWYAWGEEAFEKAKREGKPVLLSIGYSTCHWCHVMERESFEDQEIAEYLNKNYVAIKVDREQRPDLDAIYMAAVQMISGHGGWPMTVWLTPEKEPFYGGTYFPARDGDRGAQMGFLSILKRLQEIYRMEPEKVKEQAAHLSEGVRSATSPLTGKGFPAERALHDAFESFSEQYDPSQGGFGPPPKFPRPSVLRFLFQYFRRSGKETALKMASTTLLKMAHGGMYDQLGGGFHRYSTDRYWLVPHFEKMLYDQSQIVLSCVDAIQLTKNQEFVRITRETLDYVRREMTDLLGGFHSATDADSEGEEGTFFAWSKNEILELLGKDVGARFCETYGVTEEGNFEGKNILSLCAPYDKDLEPARATLLAAREKRIPPLKDDKVLTAWNGLMIAAFARAGFVLNEPKYLEAAKSAARFLRERLRAPGRLLRCYRGGKAELNGYLDDYAFYVFGLIALYEATFEPEWLGLAVELQKEQNARFWDPLKGGFFMTSHDHEEILVKEKPFYDGAEPSGNSVSVSNLLKLASFTSDEEFERLARKTLEVCSAILDRGPSVAPWLSSALDYALDRSKEIFILSEGHPRSIEPFLNVLRGQYLPNSVLGVVETTDRGSKIKELIPALRDRKLTDGRTTAFVCEKGSCQLPTTDTEQFASQVSGVKMLDSL